MKPLHFLENDYKCPASDESVQYARERLKYGNVPRELINQMTIHYQYGLKEKNELHKLLFDSSNILVSYSVYVNDSYYQLHHYLSLIGRNGIKGLTYIDTSGMLLETLDLRFFEYGKQNNVYNILCAVNSNMILTMNESYDAFERIKLVPTERWKSPVVFEDVDINEVLGIKQ